MQSIDTSSNTHMMHTHKKRPNFQFYGYSFLFLIFLLIVFINISCNSASQTIYDPSFLKGFVLDSTSAGIGNVTVTVSDFSLTTQTDTSGHFEFLNIQMPRDQFGTSITAAKTGYKPLSQAILLRSDDTTHVSFILSPE